MFVGTFSVAKETKVLIRCNFFPRRIFTNCTSTLLSGWTKLFIHRKGMCGYSSCVKMLLYGCMYTFKKFRSSTLNLSLVK